MVDPGTVCVCVCARSSVCACVKQQGDRLNTINAFNKIYSPTVDGCVEYKHIFKLHPHNLLAPHITQRRAHNINSEWRTRATMPLTRKQFAGLSCSTRRLCYLRLKAQKAGKVKSASMGAKKHTQTHRHTHTHTNSPKIKDTLAKPSNKF